MSLRQVLHQLHYALHQPNRLAVLSLVFASATFSGILGYSWTSNQKTLEPSIAQLTWQLYDENPSDMDERRMLQGILKCLKMKDLRTLQFFSKHGIKFLPEIMLHSDDSEVLAAAAEIISLITGHFSQNRSFRAHIRKVGVHIALLQTLSTSGYRTNVYEHTLQGLINITTRLADSSAPYLEAPGIVTSVPSDETDEDLALLARHSAADKVRDFMMDKGPKLQWPALNLISNLARSSSVRSTLNSRILFLLLLDLATSEYSELRVASLGVLDRLTLATPANVQMLASLEYAPLLENLEPQQNQEQAVGNSQTVLRCHVVQILISLFTVGPNPTLFNYKRWAERFCKEPAANADPNLARHVRSLLKNVTEIKVKK